VDHTLRLIQHNWVVLAYNLNVVILVLIIGESSIGAIYAYHFITVLSLLLPCIIILFLHLLSTNHKCTQPCYFPLLVKPAAQKDKMDWNSSTRSSRLCVAPVAIPVKLWSLLPFRFVESHHSL
jgi:E3 ubiquitin-protein ligase DOA10